MYRDFAQSIVERARARDEPGTRDRRSATDGSDLCQRRLDRIPPGSTLRPHRHRQRRGWRHAGARTGRHVSAHPDIERGDFVPYEPENWDPADVWKDLRYRTTEQWLDEAARCSSRTHTTTSAAIRSSGAACCTGFGGRTSTRCPRRRRVTGVASRLRHAGALLRTRRARCTRSTARWATTPPRARARRFRRLQCRMRRAWRRSSRSSSRWVCIRRRCRSGCIEPGEVGGCRLCNTCNSFPCKLRMKSDAEVCGVAASRTVTRTSSWLTNALHSTGHRPVGPDASRRGSEHARDVRALRAPVVVVSCGAVNSAALLLRSANALTRTGSPTRRARRPALHGAPRDDDAGISPVAVNTDVFQKTVAINDFYFGGPDPSTRSVRFSRRDGRTG